MQRYNIDGSLRLETETERRSREALHRGPPLLSREEALAKAKQAIQGMQMQDRDAETLGRLKETKTPWSHRVDRLLFGRNGEAFFKRHDPRFLDFKEFYIKYRVLYMKAVKGALDDIHEIEAARNALVLFEDFLDKKRSGLKIKIEKERDGLPIKALEEDIIQAVKTNPVVLIAADTGAGKSTQVPQYLLKAGFENIACTQPRRLACYSLAKRVSYESLNEYGSEIAYQVRFEGTKSKKTKILFLTEGLLLRQYVNDTKLSMYNVIIVDEVHERHVSGDFLLGVLKRLLQVRTDVRVVLMSATINASLFSDYFNAPIIQVPGRMFPVSIHYLPPGKDDRNLVDKKLYEERLASETKISVATRSENLKVGPYVKILEKIDQSVPEHERGDMLIFLSGLNEIQTLSDELVAYANYTKKWIILPLHSSLSVADQERVFDIAPTGVRKCILSTNLAETSVTIDGIRFIIDSGKVKEMMYDTDSRLSRLQEFWISQSSAKQRAGRAGRTGPGECYRLYSEKEFQHMNDFPVPEIQRTCLDPVVLQIQAYKLGDPREFDFIEKPLRSTIENSLLRLKDLEALDDTENITVLGYALALLPIDVVLGKMLILGTVCNVKEPILIIAAALSVPSPFLRVSESNLETASLRKEVFSDHGDPFTLLNVYVKWLKVKAERKSSRRWCQRMGIEEQRLYEIVKLKEQFRSILKEFNKQTEITDDEGEGAKEKQTNWTAEREYWTDTEYKSRRERQFLLYEQKNKQASSKRKVLQFDLIAAENSTETKDDEPSINELEFSIKHDAAELLKRTDVDTITASDLNLIKLILCSGLYPNIAISDEANYARKLQEQAFHTSNKRFLSMHPTSVFCTDPESIQPKPQEKQILSTEATKLDQLHGKVNSKELLCYLQLLETNKPYLTNVFRIQGLHACLLFAKNIDVSPCMTHLIIDKWLHLNIYNAEDAAKFLIISNWLRFAWSSVLKSNLKESLLCKDFKTSLLRGNEISFHKDKSVLSATMFRIHNDMRAIIDNLLDLDAQDVSFHLAKFVDMEIDYNVERLRGSDLSDWFGLNILEEEVKFWQITPYLKYYVSDKAAPSDPALPNFDLPTKLKRRPTPEDDGRSIEKMDYKCLTCKKIFEFTRIEVLRHRISCSMLN